jgi:hypothetical protein
MEANKVLKLSKRRMGKQERAEKCLLPLKMACYHAVHDYKGGVGAIAGAHGKNVAVLQNKLNPNMESHTLNISDLEMIAVLTLDERILQSVCSWYGAGYFILPTCEIDDTGLLEKSAELTRELGELMTEVSQSLADNRVDADEVLALDKALLEFTRSAAGLVAHAKRVGGVE